MLRRLFRRALEDCPSPTPAVAEGLDVISRNASAGIESGYSEHAEHALRDSVSAN